MGIEDFYDVYAERQVLAGINDRHRAILRLLRRFGMRLGQHVLEIGCGVGTLTELVADAVGPGGVVVATDLSSKSVEIAARRLERFRNLELIAGDVLAIELERRFDVVVLPDVIEHIPVDLHPPLFSRIATWVKDDGFVLLHYPNPHYLEWVHLHRPELLQIIDQPIHASRLVPNVYASGLYLDYYERYSLWVREGDYIVAVLRPAAGVDGFVTLSETPQRLTRRAAAKAKLVASRLRSTAAQ